MPANPVALGRDLLDVAYRLAVMERRRLRQAALRRTVSTAYYGIFHLLVGEARSLVSPSVPAGLRDQAARAFNHGPMKNVCRAFATGSIARIPKALQSLVAAPIETELVSLADTFLELQEERLAADYDLATRFTRADVVRMVRRARQHAEGWARVRDGDNARVFLTALLFNDLWRG